MLYSDNTFSLMKQGKEKNHATYSRVLRSWKMPPIILFLIFWADSAFLGMGQVRRGGGEIGRHS